MNLRYLVLLCLLLSAQALAENCNNMDDYKNALTITPNKFNSKLEIQRFDFVCFKFNVPEGTTKVSFKSTPVANISIAGNRFPDTSRLPGKNDCSTIEPFNNTCSINSPAPGEYYGALWPNLTERGWVSFSVNTTDIIPQEPKATHCEGPTDEITSYKNALQLQVTGKQQGILGPSAAAGVYCYKVKVPASVEKLKINIDWDDYYFAHLYIGGVNRAPNVSLSDKTNACNLDFLSGPKSCVLDTKGKDGYIYMAYQTYEKPNNPHKDSVTAVVSITPANETNFSQ